MRQATDGAVMSVVKKRLSASPGFRSDAFGEYF
jgi:hypothetical protein